MEQIRTGLRRIMSDFLKLQPQEEAAVLAWPLVCGPEVAARTRALSFSAGTDLIEVPDANWRSQLAFFTKRYVSSFDELIGPMVKEVRFEIAGSRQIHNAQPEGKRI